MQVLYKFQGKGIAKKKTNKSKMVKFLKNRLIIQINYLKKIQMSDGLKKEVSLIMVTKTT